MTRECFRRSYAFVGSRSATMDGFHDGFQVDLDSSASN